MAYHCTLNTNIFNVVKGKCFLSPSVKFSLSLKQFLSLIHAVFKRIGVIRELVFPPGRQLWNKGRTTTRSFCNDGQLPVVSEWPLLQRCGFRKFLLRLLNWKDSDGVGTSCPHHWVSLLPSRNCKYTYLVYMLFVKVLSFSDGKKKLSLWKPMLVGKYVKIEQWKLVGDEWLNRKCYCSFFAWW